MLLVVLVLVGGGGQTKPDGGACSLSSVPSTHSVSLPLISDLRDPASPQALDLAPSTQSKQGPRQEVINPVWRCREQRERPRQGGIKEKD